MLKLLEHKIDLILSYSSTSSSCANEMRCVRARESSETSSLCTITMALNDNSSEPESGSRREQIRAIWGPLCKGFGANNKVSL